jgi:hypothetical protein
MIQLLKKFKNGEKVIHREQCYDMFFYKDKCYYLDDYNHDIFVMEEEEYMKYFNEAFYQFFIDNREYSFYDFDISKPMEMIKGNIFENEEEEKFWYIDDNLIISLFYRGPIIENPLDYFVENFERKELIDLIQEVFELFACYKYETKWEDWIKKLN